MNEKSEVNFNIKIDKEKKKIFKSKTALNDITMSDVICAAIDDYINKGGHVMWIKGQSRYHDDIDQYFEDNGKAEKNE